MSDTSQSQRAIERLRGTAEHLARRREGVSQIVGREIELMASQLSAIQEPPPTLKTSDFKYPKGDEEQIPGPADDPSAVFERLIDESDLLPVSFLEEGARIQRAVARVVLTKPHRGFPAGTGWATGFMVSPTLFLTNNHVIPDKAFAKKIRVQFNFQRASNGFEQPTESFFPARDGVFRTKAALDYTLISLRPNAPVVDGDSPVRAGDRWGSVELNPSPMFRSGQHFNVIQHPSGRLKEVALQDNEIEKLFQNFVLYKADTEPGSSGSPVFDNLWQLVALHHAGGDQDSNGKWLNNEGVRIDRVVEDLQSHFAGTGDDVLSELGIA